MARVDPDLLALLRSYGRIRCRFLPFGNQPGYAPAASVSAQVTLVGQFAGARMTRYMRAAHATVSPSFVHVTTVKRQHRPSGRPAVKITWDGRAAWRLLEVVGMVGKPIWDARVRALTRWHRYRRLSKSSRWATHEVVG